MPKRVGAKFQDIFQHQLFSWCKLSWWNKTMFWSHSRDHCCMWTAHLRNVSFSLTTAGLFLVLLWCIFHIIRWIRRRVALHLNCAHAIHQTSNCDPWSLFTSQQRHCMSDGAPNTPKSVTETFHVFPNQTKLKAIICVLPQGGHFTGNN